MALSLQIQAYEQIKSKILSLEYPPNAIISEGSLLHDLDMSRTPVRESLIKLEHEHFVKILPKRGILVLPLSLADVNMIFDTRLLIEPFCLKTYYRHIPKQKLDQLCNEICQFNAADTDRFYQMDDQIHRLIAASGPNSYLNTTLQHAYDQHNRIRVLANPNISERYQTAMNEHIDILHAIQAGNIETAAKLLTEHLKTSKTIDILALTASDIPI